VGYLLIHLLGSNKQYIQTIGKNIAYEFKYDFISINNKNEYDKFIFNIKNTKDVILDYPFNISISTDYLLIILKDDNDINRYIDNKCPYLIIDINSRNCNKICKYINFYIKYMQIFFKEHKIKPCGQIDTNKFLKRYPIV